MSLQMLLLVKTKTSYWLSNYGGSCTRVVRIKFCANLSRSSSEIVERAAHLFPIGVKTSFVLFSTLFLSES